MTVANPTNGCFPSRFEARDYRRRERCTLNKINCSRKGREEKRARYYVMVMGSETAPDMPPLQPEPPKRIRILTWKFLFFLFNIINDGGMKIQQDRPFVTRRKVVCTETMARGSGKEKG